MNLRVELKYANFSAQLQIFKFALNAKMDCCRGMLFGTKIVEKFLEIACVWKSPMLISMVVFWLFSYYAADKLW